MALGDAKTLHRPMGKRKVDLPRSSARVLGRQTEAAEHALRDAVVATVLDERLLPPGSEPGFPSVAPDEPQGLELREMVKGGRRADPKRLGDRIQRSPALGGLGGTHRLEGLHLTPRQALERLHTLLPTLRTR